MRLLKLIFFRGILPLSALLYSILLGLVFWHHSGGVPALADGILVLGHAVIDEAPSPWLKARLEKAHALYVSGYAPYLIVSGGIGQTDAPPVAMAMERYLLSLGVPATSIILEDHANNTYQNFQFTARLMADYELHSLIVVTNDFHLYRSQLLASLHVPADQTYWVSAPLSFDLPLLFAYLREPLSILYNFTLWRMNPWT